MGRYCSFNTGVEVLADVDLKVFGGTGSLSATTGYYMWQWDARRDGDRCLAAVRELEAYWGLMHVSFCEFPASAEGSGELWRWLQENRGAAPSHIFEKWRVGCIIYHQLLWNPHLMGEW
jgi:hypothetical protein